MFLFPMPIAPHSLPPNPSLVAIILIVTTRRGPRFVFHYPGIPEPSQPNNSWAFGSIGSDSEDSDDSSDDATSLSDHGDTGSRAGSISSTKDGLSRSLSGKTGRWSAASASTRRTTRTLREDGPEDDEDVDDDIEDLDLSNTDSRDGKKDNNTAEDGHGGIDKDRLVEWEKLLGYPTEGLEKLLSPPDKFKRKKYEVTIEELVFLGYPVFAKEDGTWKKKEKGKKKANGRRNGDGVDTDGEDDNSIITEKNPFVNAGRRDDLNISVPKGTDISSPELSPTTTRDDLRRLDPMDAVAQPQDIDAISRSFGSTGGMSEAASDMKSMSTTSGSQGGDDMSMFHVVFVMNPPTLEYNIRVQEMYDNVVKKFSKALKYEQAKSGWVEKEAKKILMMKNQAKESKNATPMSVLWARILQQSPLAKAIANVYTSIAANKIAHVNIGTSFAASIQISQAISTSYVATPMEPQLPGLWLTTASMLEDDDGVPTLSPHAALLLLEDKETILKEIEGDNKGATDPLTFFVRGLNPTKSLQKLSTSLALPLSDMQFLARHLIYWRRARAVPPLHIRDTYIVSPNCDLKQLSRATTLYAQQFPTLPSLPSMLQLLSTKPRQYGYLIPSKDHKAAYMDILAWLLRGGWVTQLRTFAWVKVTPAVKVAAAVQLRKEAEDKAALKNKAGPGRPDINGAKRADPLGSISSASVSARRTYSEDDYISSNSTSRKSSKSKVSPRLDALISPTIRVPHDRAASDTESIASNRTAIGPAAPVVLPSPALIPLRPSPLHAVDNINPLSPPNGSLIDMTSSSAPETDSISAASAPGELAPTEVGAETILSENTILSSLPSTEEADYETSLVLSPHKANTLESRWLAHIGANLQNKELREVWGTLVKYFDGRKAVEEIASREGWKRRRVDELMTRLEAEGVLCVVRHW